MAKNSKPIDILLVSRDAGVIEATRAILRENPNHILLEREVTSSNLFSVISEVHPDIVMLDFDFLQNPFYLVDRIFIEFSDMAVIAVLSQHAMEDIDRVVLAGAWAFIRYPFQRDKLLMTVRRVMELLDKNPVTSSEPG